LQPKTSTPPSSKTLMDTTSLRLTLLLLRNWPNERMLAPFRI
jgi:hypothetical protein